jgi:GT2 family glycosyltransferase
VIATFGRPREIERLFASLAWVDSVFVCDNSGRSDIRQIVERSAVSAHYLAPGRNLGCGGGLRAAEERAWAVVGDQLTHLLVLDDDAVLEPDTLPILLDAMARENAVASYPLVTSAAGMVGWTPGLRDRRLHRLGKETLTPAEYRGRFGAKVADFDWSQGICLLARRYAVEKVGFHRSDFWVRGEDLDFSLRLTAIGRGIFVPDAVAQHVPPQSAGGSHAAEYLRHAAMVQNIAFLVTQPHGRRLRGSLLGAAGRFLRLWGAKALPDLVRAFWRGAARAQPAGTGEGPTFQNRCHALAA